MPSPLSDAKTDLFKNLIRRHNIILRNIARSIDFLQQGDFDLGLRDFLKSVLVDIDSHHSIEEAVVFPRAKDKNIKIDTLISEHQQLDDILKTILQKLEEIQTLEDLQKESQTLIYWLEQLDKFLIPHLDAEEQIIGDHFYSNILSKKESKNMHSNIFKHIRKQSIPQWAYLLFSQTEEELKHTTKFIHPFVIFVLRNIVLKLNFNKYRSQMPYYYKHAQS